MSSCNSQCNLFCFIFYVYQDQHIWGKWNRFLQKLGQNIYFRKYCKKFQIFNNKFTILKEETDNYVMQYSMYFTVQFFLDGLSRVCSELLYWREKSLKNNLKFERIWFTMFYLAVVDVVNHVHGRLGSPHLLLLHLLNNF